MQNILDKMRQNVEQNIPAGLLDGTIEIFCQHTEVYALINGSCLPFRKWPESLLTIIEEDMSKHPIAIQSLIDLGIEDRLQMIWQYARCRFGSFDGNPDIDTDGQIKHTEYWDCGFRGECPYEGKLCCSMKVTNGVLSHREIDIIRLIAEDKSTKEIADKLFISEKTVPVHLQNVFRKLGVKRRGEITLFAIKHNIIHSK